MGGSPALGGLAGLPRRSPARGLASAGVKSAVASPPLHATSGLFTSQEACVHRDGARLGLRRKSATLSFSAAGKAGRIMNHAGK